MMDHLSTAVRFLTDNLQSMIRQFIETEAPDRRDRLARSVVPVIPGATLVLGCSMLERTVLDIMTVTEDSGNPLDPSIPGVANINEWQRYLDLDAGWYGWPELGNFFRLRHCFAHDFGRLTQRQESQIRSFAHEIDQASVIDHKGEPVQQYMRFQGQDIHLEDGWIHRFRIILAGFLTLLHNKGLIVFAK